MAEVLEPKYYTVSDVQQKKGGRDCLSGKLGACRQPFEKWLVAVLVLGILMVVYIRF